MTPRTKRWLVLYLVIRAVIVTALGLLLVIRPDETLRTLARVVGAFMLVLGLLDLLGVPGRGLRSPVGRLLLIRAAITAVIGATLLFLTDATFTVVAILIGIQLVASGGASALVGYWSRSELKGWQGMVARGFFAVMIGALAIGWPDLTVTGLAVIAGIQWIVSGAVLTSVAVAASSS
jgi:uncharacterized membrane protein HdeD (DUF308 family)